MISFAKSKNTGSLQIGIFFVQSNISNLIQDQRVLDQANY